MAFSGNKPSIVFFGSGPVAAESLRLLQEHCLVEAVITKPTTVKEMSAVAQGVCVHSVNNKAQLDRLIQTQIFQSKLGVLIDFGIIVSQNVIDYFEKGIINSHFSLLPEWRGADPITFSILSGQEKTGVSLMLLVEAMDEGPILSFGVQELTKEITGPELTKKLIYLSDGLLKAKIPEYLAGKTKLIEQEQIHSQLSWYPSEASYSRKLTKQDGVLDFNKTAQELDAEIRAFTQWPKSRTEIAGKDVVITKAHVAPSTSPENAPGDIIVAPEAKMLGIATTNGTLWIDELKPAGKKEMPIAAFLAGYGSKL
jgi:methionyl-tRNA formyltransferase